MWLIAGQHLGPQDAARIGLLNEGVPDDMVLERAKEIAAAIAEMPALAVRAEKEAFLHTEHQPFEESVHYGAALFSMIQMSADAREGVAAWVEKRTPRFQGR
ncbi:TPA: enoyl-CoA hydratase-related protein [Burkholderia cepacia]|uniref:enoyl-CoA hydratase-related protein n=1 Tax=Burkholderia cepacia TaxID=292 RepID=UPI00285DBAE6|nr:hypothetical protein [Burkholderia cepacia ATCC 25416]HDV6370270.1 hypothetical protein [Burkholderia cepacia]